MYQTGTVSMFALLKVHVVYDGSCRLIGVSLNFIASSFLRDLIVGALLGH